MHDKGAYHFPLMLVNFIFILTKVLMSILNPELYLFYPLRFLGFGSLFSDLRLTNCSNYFILFFFILLSSIVIFFRLSLNRAVHSSYDSALLPTNCLGYFHLLIYIFFFCQSLWYSVFPVTNLAMASMILVLVPLWLFICFLLYI